MTYKLKKILVIVYVLIFLLLIFSKPKYISTINPSQLSLFFGLFLVAVLFHLYLEGKTLKNWFRLDVFFLLGFVIVHFQCNACLTAQVIYYCLR